jgi:pyruvate dehydrogenase E2 component (dihydrolipoamide acetyltransferase)
MNILMPQLGETVTEGKIIKWLKSVGDKIAAGDNLFEVETDKVTVEVPSMEAGVLTSIAVPEGTVAAVGAVVAVVGVAGSAPAPAPAAAPAPAGKAAAPVPASSPAPAAAAPAPAPAAPAKREPTKMSPFHEVMTPTQNFGKAKLANGAAITPLARRLAAEAGLDLSRLTGTGPRGRVTRSDVEAAMASRPAAAASAAALPAGPSADAVKALYRNVPFKEIALDGLRRTIARRLIEAKTTIPHFYLSLDVDTDRLMAVREEVNKGARKGSDGEPAYKLSVNDFIIKAWALALQDVPAANAAWAGETILQFERSDVSVAVSIPGGLITPVIFGAETKSLSAISSEMKALAARARSRSLQPAEYQGGSTSISNLGMYGIREFSAVINPPQATILAVGAAQRAPVEKKDGGVAFVGRIAVTLSCDHRVVDGALGAELLNAFKALVENPLRMVV